MTLGDKLVGISGIVFPALSEDLISVLHIILPTFSSDFRLVLDVIGFFPCLMADGTAS